MMTKVYTLEIWYYDDGDLGLRILDASGEEILHEDNIRENKEPIYIEIKTVYNKEHIYEPNEETYFNKPAGLY